MAEVNARNANKTGIVNKIFNCVPEMNDGKAKIRKSEATPIVNKQTESIGLPIKSPLMLLIIL